MKALDWAVIVLYVAMLLGVGWYYSRRTASAEDYHLGGRAMRPLTVGLSMFASLLSTLTYLAIPGEMIKNGPMILSQYLVYPLTFFAVSFLLLPVIMKQGVTSAYEILELRIGLSVRVLGSVFFLALRFMWMALIIYATSSKVLAPLLGIPQAYVPLLCVSMGLVTVVYTSMGGIRAVVMTDAIQTFILFGGALVSLALITWRLGGVGAWFPPQWSTDWQPLQIMYDPAARVTVLGAMTSSFTWYFCTQGSDQVAIQRYLATKDLGAGRRVIFTALLTDMTVGTFLGILGLALFAYFQANPQMLPPNYHSIQDADKLFPHFIVAGLPAGISGLIISGLLAAAMSSLSSGLNSTSLVLMVDFWERFGRVKSEAERVRKARRLSALVGVAVVMMSIATSYVSGNLLEVVFKVVNLLVSPLFVLFFMALFVPFATVPGTFLAAFCSLSTAIAIAYGGLFHLSFLWIMPSALLAGVLVGPLASLATGGLGRPRHLP